MIIFLCGKIVKKQPTRVVLDVGGVGYELFIPLSSYDRLSGQGEECRILTYDYVREDAHQLFGFMTEAEREMFVLLTGVSGIGPKLALSALSGLSVRDLKAAVVEGDAGRLSSISGIGRKTAERVIIELRDKISEAEALEATSGIDNGAEDKIKARDAVMALIALGFKQDAARKMVANVSCKKGATEMTVEDIIRETLSG